MTFCSVIDLDTKKFIESLHIIMVTSSIDRIIGETGIVSQLDRDSQTILFDRNYDNPVIFIQPLYNVTQPAIVQIEDIQTDRTASIQEPRLDRKHQESFDYIVLEEGTWQLEDDTVLEVGTVKTDLFAPNPWENIDLNYDFTDNPLTFSSVQTNNDRDFVPTRQRNTSTNGFQVKMEESEGVNDSGHGEEIGAMAISKRSGSWSQNSYLAATSNIARNWHTIDENNFSQSPVFLASIATYNGSDASGLGSSSLNNDWINKEDTTGDRETKQTTETVDFLTLDENIPLMASQAERVNNSFDITNCQKEIIRVGTHNSPVWLSDVFEGSFCRRIMGDVEKYQVELESIKGGFDTAIVKRNSAIRVDSLNKRTKVASTIDVELDGSGKWWVGPKLGVREDISQGLDGNYENYVIENASMTPEEYHEDFTKRGTYIGQSTHDGSVYKHYYKVHNTWKQFYAIRQNYRNSGTVSLNPILNMWRNNGLPNEYIGPVRVNVETYGQVNGKIEMSELDFPDW